MAFIHNGIHETGEGQRYRHGLLGGHPVLHAAVGLFLHPYLQLEDDQGHGFLHVRLLLCFRGGFAGLRIRLLRMSHLNYVKVKKNIQQFETEQIQAANQIRKKIIHECKAPVAAMSAWSWPIVS